MIIAATLSGWGSSSRRSKLRMGEIVEDVLKPFSHQHLAKRAMFSHHRARRFRKFILQHDIYNNVLLCVGKSLGAHNMVKQVLNPIEPLHYRKVLLLTVDPNWPEKWDWTPNLNRHTLELKFFVNKAINIYVVGKPRQQCGALLKGPPNCNLVNRPVKGFDHINVTTCPDVRAALKELLYEANK